MKGVGMEGIHWQGPLLLIAIALVLVAVATLLGRAMDLPSLLRASGWRRGGRRRARLCSTTSPLPTAGVRDDDTQGWADCLQRMDEALTAGDGVAAARAWLAALRAARVQARWEGHLAVGAARLRVADVTGDRQEAEAKARELFLLALFRARQQASVTGLLRCAESFAGLGEYQLAEQALRIAEVFAGGSEDIEALNRLRQSVRRGVPTASGNAPVQALCWASVRGSGSRSAAASRDRTRAA